MRDRPSAVGASYGTAGFVWCIGIVMSHTPEYWFYLAADFSPVLPVGVGWMQVVRRDRNSIKTSALPLLAVTVSLLCLCIGLPLLDAIGSARSLRSVIINGNFIGMTISAGMAIGKMRNGRIATAIGCFMMAFVWAFIGLL